MVIVTSAMKRRGSAGTVRTTQLDIRARTAWSSSTAMQQHPPVTKPAGLVSAMRLALCWTVMAPPCLAMHKMVIVPASQVSWEEPVTSAQTDSSTLPRMGVLVRLSPVELLLRPEKQVPFLLLMISPICSKCCCLVSNLSSLSPRLSIRDLKI